MPVPEQRLFLRGHLLIGIPPGANLQPAAYPAQIFGGMRSVRRGAGGAANCTTLMSYRSGGFDRLFRHFQNLRSNDGPGDRFLFHFCLYYRTDSLAMSDTAFLFPGQGSQSAGMGALLAQQYAAARRAFEEADEALGFPLSRLCFQGPEEDLKRTENTQPALLTVSVAAYRVLQEQGIRPSMVAGHSLGEYSALVAADSLNFPDAVRLVRKRGQYMQEAVPEGVGAMAAVLKLPAGEVERILEQAAQGEIVSAANLNSPDQIVLAGHVKAVERAMELATAAGAKRVKLLPVSAPFHCALMRPAQEKLKPDLKATRFRDLSIPLINNWQAREITSAEDAREGLYQQIPNPVRWTDTIRALAAKGIRRVVEVGAGSVLLGLVRNIDPSIEGLKFGQPADLEKLLNAAI
jgi:[acyl-carrier-protein] S-malonyltransferase